MSYKWPELVFWIVLPRSRSITRPEMEKVHEIETMVILEYGDFKLIFSQGQQKKMLMKPLKILIKDKLLRLKMNQSQAENY
jgi:hypothetical protein